MADVIAIYEAHDLIGFEGDFAEAGFFADDIPAMATKAAGKLYMRVQGGRALYESASNRDGQLDARGLVELSRLDVTAGGLHVVSRLVDEETKIEVVAL